VNRRFLRQDLLKIPPRIIHDLEDGHFVPEKILGKKTTGRGTNRQVKYHLQWAGHPVSAATWEPPHSSYQRLIDEYEGRV
jgi:hypothetical protein